MTRAFPKSGELWEHFKGIIVEVICTALHTETEEVQVVYRDVKTGSIYVRPLTLFMSTVRAKDYPNIVFNQAEAYRFTKLPERNHVSCE